MNVFKYGKCSCGKKGIMVAKASGKCPACGSVLTLSDNWHVKYTHNGASKVKSISPRKSDAELFISSVKMQIASGGLLPGQEKIVKWDDAVKSFKDWFVLGHIKQTTADMYFYCLIPLKAVFGEMSLQDITAAQVVAYQSARVKKVKPATVNREVSTLKRMFSLHCQWVAGQSAPRLHSTKNDIANIELLPENNLKTRFLSEEEAKTLLACCGSRQLKTIIYVALMTGLRLGNVLNLRWAQVADDSITIMADEMKDSDTLVIPLHPVLRSTLDSWKEYLRQEQAKAKIVTLKPSEYVFPSKSGDAIGSVRKAFSTARSKAGLDDICFHTLRHTFASNLLINGCSLSVVSESLGHNDISITKKRYGHLSHEHKKEELEKYGMVIAI